MSSWVAPNLALNLLPEPGEAAEWGEVPIVIGGLLKKSTRMQLKHGETASSDNPGKNLPRGHDGSRPRRPRERMLTHQMTAAHFDAMRLLTLSHNDRLAPADVARYVNAASRLMDIYQSACLALQKLKTKGQQRVLVQYVNVAEGGQAVVAGALRRGSRRTRRGTRKNEQ
jgi:hypothetical protein